MAFSIILTGCATPPEEPNDTSWHGTETEAAADETQNDPVEDSESGYVDVAILSTTDMHGKCWDMNVLTGGKEQNSMLSVASAVKSTREEFGKKNVILIDNGDLFQVTPVSQVQLFDYARGIQMLRLPWQFTLAR